MYDLSRVISCSTGSSIAELLGAAIIPTSNFIEESDPASGLTFCPSFGDDSNENVNYCSANYLDVDTLSQTFVENCLGQTSCEFNPSSFITVPDPDTSDPECLDVPARVSVKFLCSPSESQLYSNKTSMSINLALSLFITIGFLIVLYRSN